MVDEKRRLFLCCRHTERLGQTAPEHRNRRTAGRVLENLAVSVTRIPAVDKALNDPGLRAVADTRVRYSALQRRLRPADDVLIRYARSLIEDGDVRAVPLHGARELH